ncbi:UbiH/UbiF/VisC/COQ6 family ubiquinone biosynthesis hydroxylase [Agaribacterium sp. ZY112]|uniref:UbiH/UbiF/VisC/COQ6 family ubiquinone biosynthesis hydroxylase n=1 Tax=Agaribacterium sp. ZY112 TaxID=3233574 RepID=UPI003524CAE2
MNSKVDIAIVGGGLVGSALALALANDEQCQHWSIALIDSSEANYEADLSSYDARVVALSLRSVKLLEQLGIWSELARHCAYQKMHIWDEHGTGCLNFDCADIAQPQLGYIVENKVLLAALTKKLAQYGQIKQWREAKLEGLDTSDQVSRLTLSDATELEAELVVGADGARSWLRQTLNFETREWDYQHAAVVTTVETELPHQHCAWQRFSANGPLAFLPLSSDDGRHRSSIVWSLVTHEANRVMALDEAQFNAQLEQVFERRLGSVLHSDTRYSIALRQRSAKRYWQPGAVLVGDAAHTIHPLAGQGVNLGFYDVEVLASELSRAAERGLGAGEDATLRRFDRQRQPQNLASMAAMELFKRSFASDNLGLRYVRNQALNLVDRSYLLRQWFSSAAAG